MADVFFISHNFLETLQVSTCIQYNRNVRILETFGKLLIFKDGSPAIQTDEELKTSKLCWEHFTELFIIIRCTPHENSVVHHVIRDIVGVHSEGLQSIL